MGEDTGAGGSAVSSGTPGEEPDHLREEIEATRQELGDTVEALAEKTDVKRQAKRKLEETKGSVTETKDELLGKVRETSPETAVTAVSQASQKARDNPLPVAAAGAFLAGFLVGRLSRR